MEGIKITSFNVNDVLNPNKMGKILSKLKREKTHIAFLQETHLSDTEHTKLGRLGFKHVFSSSHASGNRRGVAILIRSTVNYEHILHEKDRERRYVLPYHPVKCVCTPRTVTGAFIGRYLTS